jgi:hypothetical protein
MPSTFLDPTTLLITVKAIKPLTTGPLATLILPDDRVFSCQPDGSAGDRVAGSEGAYERCRISGHLATFQPVPGVYHTRAFVEVTDL